MDYLDNDFIFYKNLHVHRLVWSVPAHLDRSWSLFGYLHHFSPTINSGYVKEIYESEQEPWLIVWKKKNLRMGFQFNLALHVYLITDCLNQGLNNFKQKYHVR